MRTVFARYDNDENFSGNFYMRDSFLISVQKPESQLGSCVRLTGVALAFSSLHSRPQGPHFFWSAKEITTSGKVQFSEHAHCNRFLFSANQICQT